jgi:hypothetical protein
VLPKATIGWQAAQELILASFLFDILDAVKQGTNADFQSVNLGRYASGGLPNLPLELLFEDANGVLASTNFLLCPLHTTHRLPDGLLQ